jgi:hypothetical protein
LLSNSKDRISKIILPLKDFLTLLNLSMLYESKG